MLSPAATAAGAGVFAAVGAELGVMAWLLEGLNIRDLTEGGLNCTLSTRHLQRAKSIPMVTTVKPAHHLTPTSRSYRLPWSTHARRTATPICLRHYRQG